MKSYNSTFLSSSRSLNTYLTTNSKIRVLHSGPEPIGIYNNWHIGTCLLPMIYWALDDGKKTVYYSGPAKIKHSYNPRTKILKSIYKDNSTHEMILDLTLEDVRRALICLQLEGVDIEWTKDQYHSFIEIKYVPENNEVDNDEQS